MISTATDKIKRLSLPWKCPFTVVVSTPHPSPSWKPWKDTSQCLHRCWRERPHRWQAISKERAEIRNSTQVCHTAFGNSRAISLSTCKIRNQPRFAVESDEAREPQKIEEIRNWAYPPLQPSVLHNSDGRRHMAKLGQAANPMTDEESRTSSESNSRLWLKSEDKSCRRAETVPLPRAHLPPMKAAFLKDHAIEIIVTHWINYAESPGLPFLLFLHVFACPFVCVQSISIIIWYLTNQQIDFIFFTAGAFRLTQGRDD